MANDDEVLKQCAICTHEFRCKEETTNSNRKTCSASLQQKTYRKIQKRIQHQRPETKHFTTKRIQQRPKRKQRQKEGYQKINGDEAVQNSNIEGEDNTNANLAF